MADSLRDLVVSLSLDTTNFTKNIRSINTQIKAVEADFKAMGAGIANYQQTVNGAAAKVNTLREAFYLQNKALIENEKALKAAQKTLATKQQEWLNAIKQYGQTSEEANKCRNALLNAENAVNRAVISTSNAKGTVAKTNVELEKAQQELTLVRSGWYESAESIERNDRALAILGDRVQIAANDYSAFVAGIKNADENQDALGKKSEMLGSKLETLGEKYQRLQGNLEAYQKQSKAAHEAGDNDKIRQTNQAISATEVSLSACRAEIARTTAELNDNNQQLTLVSNGWYTSAEAIEKSEHSLNILGYDLQKVTADYEAYVAGIKDAEKSEDALAAKRDRLAATIDILNKKYAEQSKQLEEYKKQLEAAQTAGDPQKVREAETNIAKAEAALASTNATLRKTSAELAQVNKDLDGHALKWKNAGEAVTTFGDKMTKRGRTMTKVGKTLTTSITTPLVAMGTYSGKAYIEFEDAMAGVRKTVDATDEKFEELDDSIRQMSLVTPTAAKDIAFVMETAGQLGIGADAIEDFTKKMVDFGNVSNSLDATTAAETFARYANIRGDAIEQNNDYFNRLTSTVFKLSNTMATTEADVSEMSMALAAAGTQVGMTDAQIVALAASLSSVGVSAQKGGTAFSKVLVKMEAAVAKGVSTNNKALADFSKVAGMTQEEFATLWKTDAGSAFMAFIDGVAKLDEEGVSAITTLQDLGLNEVRLRDTLLRTVNAQDLFVKAMASANDEWQTAEYMNEKVEERYASTANQIEILKNNATDLAMSIGEILLPYVNEFLGMARDFIAKLKDMSKEELAGKLKIAAFAAAIGPAVVAIGKLTKGLGFAFKGVGLFATAVGKAGGGLKGVGTVLAKSPALWMALAAAVVYATYKILDYVSGAKAARDAMEEFDKTAREWGNDVQSAFEKSSGLSAFNIEKSMFSLSGSDGGAQEWLDNLITVWTDGKAETKAIIDEIVKEWKDGEQELKDVADESDSAELDAIDKEIEKLLYRYQNGKWNKDFEKQLQDLITRRGEIAIKYHLEGDMESGFDDIITGMEARLRRGDGMESVFTDAFAAATEGYGAFLDSLDAEYDARYKHLKEIGADAKEYAKLDKWYNDQRNEANKEYADTMTEIGEKSAYLFVGEDGKYKMTQKKLEGIIALTKEFAEAEDTTTKNNRKADLLGALGELDEQEILDYKVAVDAMVDSYKEAGKDIPTYLDAAQKTIDTILGIATGSDDRFNDKELSDKVKEMFGGLDDESNEVYAHFNIDSLEDSFNTWAADYDHEISADATVENVTDEGAKIDIKSIDGMTATVTYIKDGEKVTEDISALEGRTLIITEVTDDGIEERNIKIHSVDGLTGKVSVLEDDTMTLMDIAALNNLTGKMGAVYLADDFVPPEIEVKGKLNFDEDGYSLDPVPEIAFDFSKQKTTTNAMGMDIGNKIADFFGADYSVFKRLSQVLDGMYELGTLTWQDFMPKMDENDGEYYYKIAEYIANGMELIRTGQMDEKERAEFLENYEIIQKMLGLADDKNNSFDKGLADKLSEYFQWDVNADNIGKTLDSEMEKLFGEELYELTNRAVKHKVDKMLGDKINNGDYRSEELEKYMDAAEEYVDTIEKLFSEDPAENAEAWQDLILGDFNTTDGKNFALICEYLAKGAEMIANGEMTDEDLATYEKVFDAFQKMLGKKNIDPNMANDWMDGVAGGMDDYDWSSTAENVVDAIENTLREAADSRSPARKYIPVGEDYAAGVGEGMEQWNAGAAAQKLADNIKAALNGNMSGSQFVTIGMRITDGLVRGIQQGQSSVVNAIIEMTKRSVQAAKEQLGIHSPSQVFKDEIGANLMKGIGEGVMSETPKQGAIIANAAKYLTDSAAGAVGSHSSIAGNSVTTNNNVSSNVTVNVSASVRSDNDIRKLAQQIARLTARVNGGYGMMNQLKA